MEIHGGGPGVVEMDGEGQTFGNCLSNFVDQGSIESLRYYLSRKTMLEMLRDRGYLVPNSEIELTLHGFRERYTQSPDFTRLTISALHKDDPSNKVLVHYFGPDEVKVNTVRNVGILIMGEALNRLILIRQNKMTTQAKKEAERLASKVEIFQITDLLVNITKHVLKPQHQLLTDEEKRRLLNKHSIQEEQLPRMLKEDAIARYYGLEKGQVLKFTHDNNFTEQQTTYRCVW